MNPGIRKFLLNNLPLFGPLISFLLNHPRLLSPLILLYGQKYRLRHGCTLGLGPRGRYLRLRKGERELRLSISHNLYVEDAVQRFDYYLDAIIPEVIDGREVADFSQPRRHRVRGTDREFEFTSFPEGIDIATAYLDIFRIKPGDTLIDAGAYCGLTAYMFSTFVGPAGKVIAIEADPRNFGALERNLQQNPAPNVTPLHAAVWSKIGTIDFASEGNMGSAVLEVSPFKPGRVSVTSLTLDRISSDLNLPRVDHVKIDIEGAEYDVIPALEPFLARYQPDFLVETHRDRNGVIDVEKLRQCFEGFGYGMRTVPQPGDEIFPLLYFFPRSAAR
jgi:FkbM family methyltransferase